MFQTYKLGLKMYNSTLQIYNISTMGVTQNYINCNKSDDFKYPLYSSVFSLVFVVGLFFNMVAVYIFGCTLKLRNETTTYMINLVVSDSLFVLSLPFRIVYFIKREWLFGSVLCKISVALFYTNMYGSILFLTCISVDRFLAIVYPFRSQTIRTKRNAKLACCTVWVMVLSGSIPTGFVLDTTSPINANSSSNFCFENYSKKQWKSELSKVVVFIETVGFIIPLMVNVFCSVMVLRTLRKPQTISRGGNFKKAKILRMILVHLLIFCFCFIPYNFNLIFYALVRSNVLKGCYAEYVVRTIYPIALCIAVTNCCFDPVIYYFTSETIQSSIKRKSTMWHNGAKLLSRLQMDSTQSSPSTKPKSLAQRTVRSKTFHNESTV
ncbi:lysophosphatidic acid receptor 6-like [Xiphias gladius]|uniref:lysophosphatidic acid receptor 6-like n=1 Tax=Xiphias gladius TaxID=8245 RepID=UPI001A998E04|nr:lysophosphatidic acid receptor 6-like [Xiphias gladius]